MTQSETSQQHQTAGELTQWRGWKRARDIALVLVLAGLVSAGFVAAQAFAIKREIERRIEQTKHEVATPADLARARSCAKDKLRPLAHAGVVITVYQLNEASAACGTEKSTQAELSESQLKALDQK